MAVIQSELTGTHTGANNQATLTSASGNFIVRGVQVNDIVYNITDGSSGTITARTATTITATLAGGVENDWDTNDSYRIWATEPNYIRFTVEDHLGYPLGVSVTVSNRDNTNFNRYLYYQKIRIQDNNNNNNPWMFLGKLEKIDSELDETYGEVLILQARDNLQELLKRLVDNRYDIATYPRRSNVISRIVSDYSLTVSGIRNIDTTDAAKFLTSADTLPADLDFNGSGINALRAIAELAQEEPRAATPAAFGFDYFLDIDFNASGAAIPDLNYFSRRSRPAGGASANGLTVNDVGPEGNQTRIMLPTYSFPTDPLELATIVRIEYLNENGADSALSLISADITPLAGVLTVGETITGGTSGTTAVIEYIGSTFRALSAWSGFFTIGETITGASSGATATVDRVLRQDIGQDVEVVIRAHEIDDSVTDSLNEARERAAGILNHRGDTVQRGKVTIVGWPAYTILGVTTMVRTGFVIRVTNAPTGINEDMIVTDIIYDEGPGTRFAIISVLGTRGRGASKYVLSRITEGVETAQWQSQLSIGGMPISSMVASVTNVFTATSDRRVDWTAGTITYADGHSHAIDLGNTGDFPDTTFRYAFVIDGNTTLQITTSFATAIGMDRNLIAIFQRNATTTEEALIVSLNSGSPQLVAGTLIVNELSALSANMGRLTAGAIVIPNATPSSISTVGFTGFVLHGSEIAGYNAGTRQVAMLSSDGTLIASNGELVLDNTAVHIIGSGQTLRFERSTFNTYFFQHNGASGLLLNTLAGSSLPVAIGANINRLVTSVSPFRIQTTAGATLQLGIGAAGEIIPTDASGNDITSASLGSTGAYFSTIWGETLRIQEIFKRSGAGGDIGSAAAYFSRIFVGNVSFPATRELDPYSDAGAILTFITQNIARVANVNHIFRPSVAGFGRLGDATNWWADASMDQLNTQDIRRRSGAGGDIGSATEYFSNLYIGSTRARITGSTGDMDFYVDDGAGVAARVLSLLDGANRTLDMAATAYGIDLNVTRLFGIRSRTTTPVLADLDVGEIVMGDLGNTATDGRFWVKVNSAEIFEFASTARIT